jgi:hypothetical protein
VLPTGVSPHMLCPAGLASHPRPPALEGARGFIFLHRGSPEWHNGAGVLLEAYGQAFSAADDVTLVLHVPPGESYQYGPQLEELKAQVGRGGLSEFHCGCHAECGRVRSALI